MRCSLAATLVALLIGGSARAADTTLSSIAWVEDWGAALKQAKEENRLLMVDFYTSWCLYCKNLDKEAFVDPRVVSLSKDFVCTKLDAEVVKAAAMRYSPEGFPTIVFGASNGDEILRLSGYRTADEVYAVMKAVHDSGPKIAEYLGRIEKNRKDAAAHEALGEIYLALGIPDKATSHLEQALKLGVDAADAPDRESDEAHAMHALAQALMAEKEYKKAAKTLDKLVASHPDSPECPRYYELLEKAWTELGKPEGAAAAREKAAAAREKAAALAPR